jgi:alpha-tubulin suppressor-like RCC1 family protein
MQVSSCCRRVVPLLLIISGACSDSMTSPAAPRDPDQAIVTVGALSFRQVSMGNTMVCGVTTSDIAYCWGTGYLGDGGINIITQDRPTAVVGGLHWRQISVSGHVCGLTTDERAYCWGGNSNGELGNGSTQTTNAPTPVLGGLTFRQIRAGITHTCAVTPDDEAYCWGANFFGQVGDGTTTSRSIPVRVQGALRFRQVFANGFYTCGATVDDRGFCWGDNTNGQLGNGRFGRRNGSLVPIAIAGKHAFRQVIAGLSHACGITRDDRLLCWGENGAGQLGDGTNARRSRPAVVTGGRRFDVVSAGGQHTCGAITSGRLFCWGSNLVGQLGDGSTTHRLQPTAVAGGLKFTSVSVSSRASSCGIAADARLFCWGEGVFGVLGNGAEGDQHSPTPVEGPN